MAPIVLMVAEKPAVALSIAVAVAKSQMSSRRGSTEIYEFRGKFQQFEADFRVTAVTGHVYGVDFPVAYQNWEATDPADLFDAPVIKVESNPKARICQHLKKAAVGCDYLVLWLDCDREGENICYEVIECTGFDKQAGKRIYRARFSSTTEKDILKAMNNLVKPNPAEALAVDARQEIDLKIGVAFTRFQTRHFHGKYGNLDSRVISYGPCQTPTLGFCVQRYLDINTFVPETFWQLQPFIMKGGYELVLEWSRNRLFDFDVAVLFQKCVLDASALTVRDVSVTEEYKGRPCGLNTVNLLKIASRSLGLGPHVTMQLAERLYTQGFISYPRTESTSYPASIDFRSSLEMFLNSPMWGIHVHKLLAEGFKPPRAGIDVGDHPPITPTQAATEDMLSSDSWRLYQYVVQHFIGTISPDCKYLRTKVEFSCGGEMFHCSGVEVLAKGFTSVMPWMEVKERRLPPFSLGEKIKLSKLNLYEGRTAAPDFLTESELISLMEKNGIGTDASIPVHIQNICERNFVQVQAGRRLVPTTLGVTLIRGYQNIDPDLCLPEIRSFIEQQITLVAKGQVKHIHVVKHVLQQFKQKYSYFVMQIGNMDALFEAQFSSLADSGRALSKCGKCARYMKYISSKPSRLYCSTCEEVYNLPLNGLIKLYKELVCPLDSFELLLFSATGAEGKSFPFCPYCYNYPPFDEIENLMGTLKIGSSTNLGRVAGMSCFHCPHPTCCHSVIAQGVCACPECNGVLVLNPVSAPKWRLQCNTCNCLVFLAEGAHRVVITSDQCPQCESTIVEIDFNKNATPLSDGRTLYTACILCDELLHSLIKVKHGKSLRHWASKNLGNRRNSKGRPAAHGISRKQFDPKMSFRDF